MSNVLIHCGDDFRILLVVKMGPYMTCFELMTVLHTRNKYKIKEFNQ
jgi:hypothetical protein